jgi:hypothetical protein
MNKEVLGLIEYIEINGRKFKAKIDTGADHSSIDLELATELGLGPLIGIKKIKSSHGRSVRPITYVEIVLKGKKMKSKFNLFDRENMKYPILIGINILKRGFLIDPTK